MLCVFLSHVHDPRGPRLAYIIIIIIIILCVLLLHLHDPPGPRLVRWVRPRAARGKGGANADRRDGPSAAPVPRQEQVCVPQGRAGWRVSCPASPSSQQDPSLALLCSSQCSGECPCFLCKARNEKRLCSFFSLALSPWLRI